MHVGTPARNRAAGQDPPVEDVIRRGSHGSSRFTRTTGHHSQSGLHIELTGDETSQNASEVSGRPAGAGPAVSLRALLCDPSAEPRASLELAFEVAQRLEELR